MIKLYLGVFVAFVIGAIAVACILMRTLKKGKPFDLVQGKLASSDDTIEDAISCLKLTNEQKA